MIIWGEGETLEAAEVDHDRHLKGLLERCRKKGMNLNPEKFRFRVPEVAYVGHKLSGIGLRPGPQKVSAIRRMETPSDKAALQWFLGMINYPAKFVPHLSDLGQPLRQLLQKDNKWVWLHEQDKAVAKIKDPITTAPTLKYFNETKEVIVHTDASSTGLGAVILQEGQPVAYTSRALTKTKSYSQIEKELLGVLFSLEHLDHYVYGRKVTVHSDHKPLEIIANKPILTAREYSNGCYNGCSFMTTTSDSNQGKKWS